MKNPTFLPKLLPSAGYLWAAALVLAMPVFFFGMDGFAHRLARLPFMKVHPKYTGGEIVETAQAEGVEWRIHRPVFDGLTARRANGFVQIDAVCVAGATNAALERDVDYDRDGRTDFRLVIPAQPGTAPQLEKAAPNVTGIGAWARTKDGWIVRVGLDERK